MRRQHWLVETGLHYRRDVTFHEDATRMTKGAAGCILAMVHNLVLGLMVALQGPLIMMSQNRQTQQDRAQAASDFRVNLKNEVGIETLLREQAALRRNVDLRLARIEETIPPAVARRPAG